MNDLLLMGIAAAVVVEVASWVYLGWLLYRIREMRKGVKRS